MYHDEIFENSLREAREESYCALKQEISAMELAIEKFFNNLLECTTSIADRDYNAMSMF